MASLVRSASVLGAGTLAAGLLGFGAQVLFARLFGRAGYGAIASAQSLVNLLASAAVFGVNVHWLRAFGRDGYAALPGVGPSLRLVLASATASGGLLVLLIAVGPFDELTRKLLPWFAAVVAAQAIYLLVRARLQLEERFSALALWQTTPSAGRLVIAVSLGLAGAGFGAVGVAFAAWSALAGLVGALLLRPLVTGRIRLAGHVDDGTVGAAPEIGTIAADAAPFALSALAFWTYFQCDILLLNWIRGEAETGLYGVAVALVSALQVVPQVVYTSLVRPMQHRWADHERHRLDRSFVVGNRIMLGLGTLGALALAVASPWVIPLAFGRRFTESVPLVMLLAICIPLRFLTTSAAGMTSTTGRIGSQVRLQMGTAGLNLALNAIAIPWLGATGAALTTVASEAVMTIALQRRARAALSSRAASPAANRTTRSE